MVTANKATISDPLKLMLQAKAGDQEAFGQLYQAFLAPVYRYVLVRIGDQTLAEDITQIVFLKIYQSLSRYKPQTSTPLAYFFTVARNTIIDHWKKKKELPLNEITDVPDHSADLTKITDNKLALESLMKTLNSISPEHQEIINLKYIAGLTNKEIAELLNKNEVAVRQMQCRALKAIRQKLIYSPSAL